MSERDVLDRMRDLEAKWQAAHPTAASCKGCVSVVHQQQAAFGRKMPQAVEALECAAQHGYGEPSETLPPSCLDDYAKDKRKTAWCDACRVLADVEALLDRMGVAP